MDDDLELLRDLARNAPAEEAEERQLWERWDRLADGGLSPEEEAELQALVATSAEDKMAFEAFRPLDEDFRARMAEKIGEMVGKEAAFEERNTAAEHSVTKAPPRSAPAKESRRWFAFAWWRTAFMGSGLAAAAAAWFLFIRVPAMPEIVLANLQSSVEISRGGSEGATPVLRLGTDWSVLALPSAKLAAGKKLESACYLRARSAGERKLRDANCSVLERNARTGAPKIGGHLPSDLPVGPATLWIVLAYSGELPAPEVVEKLPADRSTNHRTWVADPAVIEVRAR